jgi:hypothetical protein
MIECFFIEKSWDWQFWGDDPPMKLLRHTWKRREEPDGKIPPNKPR